MEQEYLPEKERKKAPGHLHHDASTTSSKRLWLIQHMINV